MTIAILTRLKTEIFTKDIFTHVNDATAQEFEHHTAITHWNKNETSVAGFFDEASSDTIRFFLFTNISFIVELWRCLPVGYQGIQHGRPRHLDGQTECQEISSTRIHPVNHGV